MTIKQQLHALNRDDDRATLTWDTAEGTGQALVAITPESCPPRPEPALSGAVWLRGVTEGEHRTRDHPKHSSKKGPLGYCPESHAGMEGAALHSSSGVPAGGSSGSLQVSS